MINKTFLYLFFVFVLLIQSGCQSLKDGLQGNKKSKSAEEFLIEKKSPLVLPPDFSKLPEPKQSDESDTENEFDLQKILGEESKNEIKNKNKNSSFEKSIIDKIKNEQ